MAGEDAFGKNAALNALSWLVPSVAALVCVPITVRGLGPDSYGLMALVTALTGYLGIVEMGLGQALIRYLAYYRALDEGRPMVAIIWAALRWFATAGVAVGLLPVLFAPWICRVLQLPEGLLSTGETVVRLSAANLVLGLLLTVGAAVPVSFLRYDLAALAGVIVGTANWVGPAVMVSVGYGLVGVVWFYIASNLGALILYAYLARKLFIGVKTDVGPTWKEIRRSVLSFAGLVAANRVGFTVAEQTNRLMVGITTGTAAAGYFQVPYVLATKITQLLTRVAQVLFPMGSALIARGDYSNLRVMYLRSSRLLFLLTCSTAVAVGAYAYPLLQFWVDPTYAEEGSTALVILVITQALNAAALAVGFLSWSAARAGTNLLFAAANSAINLAVIYPLASQFGVSGAAGAALLGALVQPFFIHYVNKRMLHVSSPVVFRHCYLPTLGGSALAVVASRLLLVPHATDLLATGLLMCVSGIMTLVMSGLFGALTREDLRSIRTAAGSLKMRLGL